MNTLETPEQEVSWWKYFWPLANTGLGMLIVYFLVFPYLQAEVNTLIHQGHKDELVKFCVEEQGSAPRDIKILKIERHKLEIRFYCLYDQTSKNQELIIHKTSGQWRVFSRKDLGASGEFYWPLYF
jgi:hypothetical protein